MFLLPYMQLLGALSSNETVYEYSVPDVDTLEDEDTASVSGDKAKIILQFSLLANQVHTFL